jgi:hypothetical protein
VQISNRNIWFVLGLSGAGKSRFSKYIANCNDWLYFEIDFWKAGIQDGLDCYGLRDVWNQYEKQRDAKPLIDAIARRFEAEQKAGAIFDFPSSRIINHDQIQLIKEKIKVLYLVAEPSFCLAARAERQQQSGGNDFGEQHWHQHNDQLLSALSDLALKPHCLEVVHGNTRKTEMQLYEEAMMLE